MTTWDRWVRECWRRECWRRECSTTSASMAKPSRSLVIMVTQLAFFLFTAAGIRIGTVLFMFTVPHSYFFAVARPSRLTSQRHLRPAQSMKSRV